MRRKQNKQLQRSRSEFCERTFAHICDSGGGRRTWLRSLLNVKNRYLIAAAAHNLGRILRKLFGVGNPKNLQVGSDLAALMQIGIRGQLIARTMSFAIYRCDSRHYPVVAA
jgi:DDE family transposase